ncbi:unnamed protein product [Plutella xylostella]|uniref:(diamondback moth) hypothetical protein n=1 Tax=Plutella xylostella TaxID=51655 RepID=A0A8S4G462_PLUXY|nr:unnamed protein product [Plutella xylostella]
MELNNEGAQTQNTSPPVVEDGAMPRHLGHSADIKNNTYSDTGVFRDTMCIVQYYHVQGQKITIQEKEAIESTVSSSH